MSGTLYFGDNLDVLREHVRDETIDLVYLDPPFNSAASYNVLFKAPDGKSSQSQITAFEDTWHWCDASEVAFDEVMRSGRSEVANVLRALRQFLGENDMMAYLAMMTVRLIELHRVLKKTGSAYLHCDPTASHYLKIVMDAVFKPINFRNEIVWKRTSSHGNVSANYGDVTDTILYFSKSEKTEWNKPCMRLSDKNIREKYTLKEKDGRLYTTRDLRNPGVRPNLHYEYKGYLPHPNGWSISREKMAQYDAEGKLYFPRERTGRIRLKLYLEESVGQPMQSLWEDIPPLNSQAQERMGYPTQKPVALLERIIAASSKPDGLILDPFCGCGTTVHAAQKLGRPWLGIDITPLAVNLISRRLKEAFEGIQFDVRGIPRDLDGARELANRDKHLFQLWACNLVDAQPFRDGKKGADGGIDGMIYFKPDGKATKAAIVSVKGGGNVGVAQVRDLRGTIERLKEPMGVFVTLTPPTAPMEKEAASAGLYDTGFQRVPRLQIMTIERLLAGHKPEIPFGHTVSYKRATRERVDGHQIGLEL